MYEKSAIVGGKNSVITREYLSLPFLYNQTYFVIITNFILKKIS
jgi:hypothetical protein